MRISDWSSDVCSSDLRTIYLPAISGSNETTGVDCQRYGFRLCYYAYPACKAIAPVLAKALGKDRKAIYLVPDYTYGHTTYDSMVEFTEKQGWKTVGEQVHPLGAKDYSSSSEERRGGQECISTSRSRG